MCLGIALMQTFHSKQREPAEHAKFAFRLKPAWILSVVEGLIVFSYGFIGFWLCERKRRFWRINLHCPSFYICVELTFSGRRVSDVHNRRYLYNFTGNL